MPRRDQSDRFRDAAELMGRKVATAREARSLTQEQLAEKTGISRNQIQNIERNRNNTKDPETGRPGPANARLDTIYLIADALQVEVTWLVDSRDRQIVPTSESEAAVGGGTIIKDPDGRYQAVV